MAASGPSQFAQLLKRSKFASFDPTISQIYTTYGGYAHRGDFGLKRAFPPTARNKKPYVVVKAVDDSLGQTQWSTAQNQGRWMERFDESGASAEPMPGSPWSSRARVMAEWHLDSSFDRPWTNERVKEETPAMVPNPKRMTQAEFDAYLDKLRNKRGEFRQFIQNRRQEAYNEEMTESWEYWAQVEESSDIKPPSPPKPVNLLEESRTTNNGDFREFLQHEANERAYAEEGATGKPSQKLVPSPHPNAGLSYTKENKLQRSFLNPTLPARLVQTSVVTAEPRNIFASTPSGRMRIAVAGTLAEVKRVVTQPLRLDAVSQGAQEVDEGEIQAQIEDVSVITGPHVVGKHSGLGGGRVLVKASEFHVPTAAVFGASYNPHTPGTAEYVGWEPVKQIAPPHKVPPATFTKPTIPIGQAAAEASVQLRELATLMKERASSGKGKSERRNA